MAWCDVVEPCTLRECRIALGQSQAAFAATLGVSPESYRTWDTGRRVTPPKMLARARALATHRDDDDHALLPLPVLALLIGVHVKTLRAGPARCHPTGSSPADAIRRWSAEGGHPIQDLTTEDDLACSPAGRGTEVDLACNILNQMTVLGRPMSYRIGR